MGEVVSSAMLQVLNSEKFLEGFNHTFITLIPPKNRVSRVEDIQSISICNVIYKLVAKVIANRLKTVLLVVISETQGTFVPERKIIDNILVAYKLIHFLKHKRKGK